MADVKIRLVAVDETGKVFEGTIEGLDGIAEKGKKTKTAFEEMSGAIDNVANLGQRAIGVFNRLDIQQLTLTQSAERVQRAQDRVVAAITEHGEASEQAIAANRELTAAQDAQEKASRRTTIAYAAVGAEVIGIATKVPAAVAGLSAMTGHLHLTAGAGITARAALLGVAGAVGVVAASAVGLSILSDQLDQINRRGERGLSDQELLAKRQQELQDTMAQRMPQDVVSDVIDQIPVIGLIGKAWESNTEKVVRLGDEIAVIEGRIAQSTEAQDTYNASVKEADRIEAQLVATLQEEAAAQALRNGLMSAGINLQNFSAATLEKFLPTLAAVRKAEDEATTAVLRSSAAFRNQADITAFKDETTAAFIERLKGLGFTEAEIAARLDESGRRLMDQAEATEEATKAAEDLTKAREELAKTEQLFENDRVSVERFTPGSSASTRQGGTAGAGGGGGSGFTVNVDTSGLERIAQKGNETLKETKTIVEEQGHLFLSVLTQINQNLSTLGQASGQDPLRRASAYRRH